MAPRSRLLLATGNPHKVEEITQILRGLVPDLPFDFVSTREFPGLTEPEETGATFLDNALLKARYYSRETGLKALADDSGLVIDALEGRPGIHSARYAETPEKRIERVLSEMKEIPIERRTARFVCVVAFADPSGSDISREGRIEGRIALAPRGEGGFGYDPIFEPDEQLGPGIRTLAQFGSDEKNRISHRGRALTALAPLIR